MRQFSIAKLSELHCVRIYGTLKQLVNFTFHHVHMGHLLQVGPNSVHMFNSEGVERVLATMSHKGFEITVAHVSPWPRNLTEKKYAISKIKQLWEMKQSKE